MNGKSLLSLFVATAVVIGLPIFAYAQQPGQQPVRKPPKLKADEYAPGLKEFKEKPPDMPGIQLPMPPGAKYKLGFSGAGGGGKYVRSSAEFEMPESPSTIVSYYANALKSSGWQILEQKPGVLSATNPKMKASVEIQATSILGKTHAHFGYRTEQ